MTAKNKLREVAHKVIGAANNVSVIILLAILNVFAVAGMVIAGVGAFVALLAQIGKDAVNGVQRGKRYPGDYYNR